MNLKQEPTSNGEIAARLGTSHSRWRAIGSGIRFFGVRADEMNRDELLTLVGWFQASRDAWREMFIRRMD
jgi:hypothetical protein